MRNYQRPETVQINVEIHCDERDEPFDPDSYVKISIVPRGVGIPVVDREDMKQSGVGLYSYPWNSSLEDVVGWYEVTIEAEDGSLDTGYKVVEKGGFTLE